MARRFGTSFALGGTKVSGQVSMEWGNQPTMAGGRTITNVTGVDGDRLFITPAAYSEVRKVVFWAAIRHTYTGAVGAKPVRLRVAPSSSSNAARVVESGILNSGQIKATNNIAVSPAMFTIVRAPTNASFYDGKTSGENAITTLQFPLAGLTQGSQLIYREFDRFDAADAAFFNDWDAIAANGNPNEFIAYTLGIERTDAVNWNNAATNSSNYPPQITTTGFAIVQAPSPNNRTRILIPCSMAWFATTMGANPATQGGQRGGFKFNASEWSGAMEMRLVSWQEQGDGVTPSGRHRVRVVNLPDLATRYDESFDAGAQVAGMWMSRTQDFLANVVDGDYLGVQRSSPDVATVQGLISYFEITLENFTTFTAFFGGVGCPPTPQTIPDGSPPPPSYAQQSTLFDPIWFQDMESFRFLSSNVGMNVIQLNTEAPEMALTINAFLEANVSLSAFNAEIAPRLGSGPEFVYAPLTSNNPLNLAGKRKITVHYDGTGWEVGNDIFPAQAYISFVVVVPNTDVVELGPLFDLGSFNAEGCAATSAGLGEPPVLVITNGATIPKKFNPTAAGTDGEVEDAGIPTPFEGETPQAVPGDAAASPDGGLDLGTYRYRYTFRNCCTGKESDPNPDDIVVDTSGQAPAAQVTFSFAGVRIPGDPQICEICLYRTVEGGAFPIMAKVGCFNIDDTTIFVDDMSDDALDFLNDGLSILNAPMPCVPIVVDFRNRLFGMGDIPNLALEGTVSVVNGSDIVTGDGEVEWDRCLEGKFIKVGADCRSYEILRVLPPDEGESPPIGRLKLVDAYEGASGTGLAYEICGRPNRLYFSEPLEPEYWPAANFLDVEPGDGDRLMGAVSNFDRLVICKRRKTYVLTFRENPGIEVFVPSRISSDIGCIGPRTFAQVESGSVWLADRGLALYDGRTVQHVPESQLMNDIFTNPDNPNYVRRDRNGRVIEAVGVFSPTREQYLLLLPTVQTNRGCDMMLVWDVKLRNITLLKFCQQFLSMVVGKDSAGNERVYLGDVNGFVWIYDIGDCDGVGFPNATGTVRGTVGFAGVDPSTGASVLDDDSATFIEGGIPGLADLSGIAGLSGAFGGGEMGLAGVCVYTRRKGVDYDAPWTMRQIYAATNTRLYVTPQWGPDTPFDPEGEFEFDYMIGAIEFDQLFKPQNYGTDDMSKRDWRQIVVHEVEGFASQVRIDLLPDFSMVDPEADTVVDPVTEETGEGRVFRMDYAKGRQVKPVGRNVHFYMAVRMRNFAPEEPIRIINHLLGVEPRVSK